MTMTILPTMILSSMLFSAGLSTLLLAAVISDVTRLRIPNLIPLGVVGLFTAKLIFGIEASPWMAHLLIALLALLLGFLAFAGGLLGGGDAKLIAALALWFGPILAGSFITITGITGGILAMVLVLVRRCLPVASSISGVGLSPERHRWLDPTAPIPYALPIAFAALWLEWF